MRIMADIDNAKQRWPNRTWRGDGRIAVLLCGKVGVLVSNMTEAYKIAGVPCRRPDGYDCSHLVPQNIVHRVERLDPPTIETRSGREYYGFER
jgi:hypothetical protein